MSYLDDRLLKIIEQRRKGVDSAEIGNMFGACARSLEHYETCIRNVIRKSRSYRDAAERLFISEEVVRKAASYYKVKLTK